MEEFKYKVYAQVDSNNVITEIQSNLRQDIDFATGWTQIDEGIGDKYSHAQGNYFSEEKPLRDSNGKYNYKLVDGKVVERTENEKVDLYALKQIKIQELSDRCNEVITKEFYSDADGTKRNYGLDLENQIRIKSMADDIRFAQQIGQTVNNVSYYAQGESPCREYTPEQFLKLSDDAKAWVFKNVNKYKDKLKLMIETCKTVDDVNAITWDSVSI